MACPYVSLEAVEEAAQDLLTKLLPAVSTPVHSTATTDMVLAAATDTAQTPYLLHAAGSPALDIGDADVSAASASELLELSTQRLTVLDLEREVLEEDDALAQLDREYERSAANLASLQHQTAAMTSELQLRQRTEQRQAGSAKLLQLQLTVATQLYGVAESLSQVAAASGAGAGTGGGASGVWAADTLQLREREVQELRRALKRQQQLVSDAHRQLLELSTRKKPMGAASMVGSVDSLRAALAEQEMARMMAEARADELQSQVRLLEEQGLRVRLHPPPLATEIASPVRTARMAVHLSPPQPA